MPDLIIHDQSHFEYDPVTHAVIGFSAEIKERLKTILFGYVVFHPDQNPEVKTVVDDAFSAEKLQKEIGGYAGVNLTKNLIVLILNGWTSMTEIGKCAFCQLGSEAEQFIDLRLNLPHLKFIQREAFREVGMNSHFMKQLSFEGCNQLFRVGDKAFLSVGQNAPLFEKINFQGCNRLAFVMNKAFSKVGQNGVISELDLSPCKNLQTIYCWAFSGIGQRSEHMQYVKLDNLPKLTTIQSNAFRSVFKASKQPSQRIIVNKCPRLKEISVAAFTCEGASFQVQLTDSENVNFVEKCSNEKGTPASNNVEPIEKVAVVPE